MLEEGRYRSAAEIAEVDGVTRSFVNRLLRLTLLTPDIVEAILDGRQPKGGDAVRGLDAGDAERVRGAAKGSTLAAARAYTPSAAMDLIGLNEDTNGEAAAR